MMEDIKKRQAEVEADRIAKSGRSTPFFEAISGDERVQSLPLSKCAPPRFLEKTAGKDSFELLSQFLLEMRELNERYVGETCLEAQVHILLAGEDRVLRTKLQRWTETYIRQRLTQYSPKDCGDPYETFLRLVLEYDSIATGHFNLSNTINFVFEEIATYAHWLIHRQNRVAGVGLSAAASERSNRDGPFCKGTWLAPACIRHL